LASKRELDRPAIYELRVKGSIEAEWASYWFEGMTVTALPKGESMLIGPVADLSALLGLLARVRDLGLPLLSVTRKGYGDVSEEKS
jgi:hypothetical protein